MRVVVSLAFLGLLAGCGREVCVMGIGDCNEKPITTTQSGKFEVTADKTRVEPGNTITLTVRGGRAPFRYSLVEGDGRIENKTGNTAVFTASSKLGVVLIRVRDDRDEVVEIPILCVDKL